MKLLRVFEWIAGILLITCTVIGFGKVFVDQVVAITMPQHRTSTVWVAPITAEERADVMRGGQRP